VHCRSKLARDKPEIDTNVDCHDPISNALRGSLYRSDF